MKKSWRAILCGVMAIAMTASLAGCGSNDDSSSESDSSSAEETMKAVMTAAQQTKAALYTAIMKLKQKMA